MTLACARALRICALLGLPVSAFAQSSRSPTIFSPSWQVGTVNVRAAVVLTDYTVKPLPLLDVVALRSDLADTVSGRTDAEGKLSMSLHVGTYTLRAKTPQPVGGRSYTWAVPITVRHARVESVQLTNSNASVKDSVAAVATVAALPQAVTTPAAPQKPAPAQKTVPAKKAVATDSAKPVVVAAAPAANPFVVKPTSAPLSSRTPDVVQVRPARVNTRGLMLGLALNGSGIRSEDLNSTTESGAGLAGQLGWGFTKNFALLLSASGARIGSVGGNYDLAQVDLGGRWHFVNSVNGIVPFVEVGYAARAATKKDVLVSDGAGTIYPGDLTILGGGVSFGGGLEYFVTRRWALGGSFRWTTGQFSSVRVDNVTMDGFAIDATSGQFNMGFSWYPMGKGR